MAELNGISVPFIPIEHDSSISSRQIKVPGERFRSVFEHEIEKLKVSGHAQKRLDSRNIELNVSAMERLNDAVTKAESKGAKDSLIMMDNTAFIVSISNRTIVTAMDLQETKENLFTNIDSVLIL